MVTHGSIPYRPNKYRTGDLRPGLTAARADETPVDLRCSVVVVRDGEILLVHRSAKPHDWQDGDWVLPGGRPRPGESMIACARRETIEETGLDVVIGRCLFVLDVGAPPHDERTVELVFSATPPRSGRPESREPDRHVELVPLPMARQLRLRPPIVGYLQSAVERHEPGAAYLGNLWRHDRHDTAAADGQLW
jgi:8-oxo-dGTP pyrophosphatase MutT (NUDIX family)